MKLSYKPTCEHELSMSAPLFTPPLVRAIVKLAGTWPEFQRKAADGSIFSHISYADITDAFQNSKPDIVRYLEKKAEADKTSVYQFILTEVLPPEDAGYTPASIARILLESSNLVDYKKIRFYSNLIRYVMEQAADEYNRLAAKQ